jgi:hypothetical protein
MLEPIRARAVLCSTDRASLRDIPPLRTPVRVLGLGVRGDQLPRLLPQYVFTLENTGEDRGNEDGHEETDKAVKNGDIVASRALHPGQGGGAVCPDFEDMAYGQEDVDDDVDVDVDDDDDDADELQWVYVEAIT